MTRHWADLGPRIISAVVLLSVASLSALTGPVTFGLFVACVSGVMTWELVRLHVGEASRRSLLMGLFAALGVGAFDLFWTPDILPVVLLVFAAFSVIYLALIKQNAWSCAIFGFCIAATGVIVVEMAFSEPRLLFLLLGVVVAADVGGYFAGRLIGGPKFWPSISPKKTWAGVLGGWFLAAAFAGLMDIWWPIADWLPFWAVAIAFCAQMGDIAESWLKRQVGAKDSSNLIPGHGGFLDRFDGVVGAALALAVMAVAT